MPDRLPNPPPPPACRLVPGMSREEVARALGLTPAEVARIERRALLKCLAELTRRGHSYRDLISLLTNDSEPQSNPPP